MRRPVHHRWLAWLLAPLVLLVNAAPVTTSVCRAGHSVSPQAKTCCGCCRAEAQPSPAQPRHACCAKRLATKPKCCCEKGSVPPATPATVPESGEQLKQVLLAGFDLQIGLVHPAPPTELVGGLSAPTDISAPPIRVRFCIWQT